MGEVSIELIQQLITKKDLDALLYFLGPNSLQSKHEDIHRLLSIGYITAQIVPEIIDKVQNHDAEVCEKVPGWVELHMEAEAAPMHAMNEYIQRIVHSVSQDIMNENSAWLKDTVPLLISEKLRTMPDVIGNVIRDMLLVMEEHSIKRKKSFTEDADSTCEISSYVELLSTFAYDTTKQLEITMNHPIFVPLPELLNRVVLMPIFRIAYLTQLKNQLAHKIREKLTDRVRIYNIEAVVKVCITSLVERLKERMIFDISNELDT